MRHRRTTPKLGRTASHRDAMLRTMVTDLLRHEKIRTTQAKAKALRRVAERMITLGKRESLHARRRAARVIRDKAVVRKLFEDLAPRYMERPGGYTRIVKLPVRAGDAAEMAIIELVEAKQAKPKKKRPKKKGGPRTAAQDTAAAAQAAPPAAGAAGPPPASAESAEAEGKVAGEPAGSTAAEGADQAAAAADAAPEGSAAKE